MPEPRQTATQNQALFFICYAARSGSTHFSNLLVKHAPVSIPPESTLLTKLFKQYPRNIVETESDLKIVLDAIYSDPKFADWHIGRSAAEKQLRELLPCALSECLVGIFSLYTEQTTPGAQAIGIKHGKYVYYYKKLKHYFPRAQFVCLIRDGRAVFNSQKKSINSRTNKPFAGNAALAAIQWCAYVKYADCIAHAYPEQTFRISYENIVQHPKTAARNACAFLNIPFTPDEKREYVLPERYDTLHPHAKQETMPSRADAWKRELLPREIAQFEFFAGSALKRAGYALTTSPVKRFVFSLPLIPLYCVYSVRKRAVKRL